MAILAGVALGLAVVGCVFATIAASQARATFRVTRAWMKAAGDMRAAMHALAAEAEERMESQGKLRKDVTTLAHEFETLKARHEMLTERIRSHAP